MSTHKCPGPDCTKANVPYEMLMCARHWYQVPKALRNRVWATWEDGEGASSPEHIDACDAAVRSLTEPEPPDELAARRAGR